MNTVITSSILLALFAFSLAVDAPPSRNDGVESPENVNTLEKWALSSEKTNAKVKQLIRNFEEMMKYDIFGGNNTVIDSGKTGVEGRGKKGEKLMQSLYMGMMMAKSFFSIVFMFINQLFQLKNFGFQLLNAIINVGRFILQYQQHASQQQKNQVVKVQSSHDWGLGGGSTGYGYNPGYAYYQPSGFSGQQSSVAAAAAERFAKLASSANNNGYSNSLNLHANNLAYSAYVPTNTAARA